MAAHCARTLVVPLRRCHGRDWRVPGRARLGRSLQARSRVGYTAEMLTLTR